MIAIALFSYAFPTLIGGNGYLSVYVVGIMIGNHDFPEKKDISQHVLEQKALKVWVL